MLFAGVAMLVTEYTLMCYTFMDYARTHKHTHTHTHTHKQLAYLTVKVHKFTSKKKIADNNI